jgi:hypothetical protein
MDASFWIVQLALLAPLAILAIRLEDPLGDHDLDLLPEASEFSPQERARQVRLRDLVRAARAGQPTTHRRPLRWWACLAALALILSGGVGMLETYAAMDVLQPINATQRAVGPADRLLPGLLAHPDRYLAAINASTATVNDLYTVSLLELKEAMDRSEAALAAGAGLLLLALSAAPDATGLPSDVAPFLLVAAFLCAGLSFFELP